jgi:predicted porin
MSRNPGWQGEGRASRIGVKGSEDLGGGLKAIYQVEFGVSLNDNNGNPVNNNETVTMRNSFVGLAGGWGTFLMGRHDTPLKISTGKLDLFSDTMADYNGTIGFQDLRADNVVAYISPSWGGFTLAAAVVPAGGGIALGTGSGIRNINSDQINGAYSLAGIYSNGPFYASAAYESINQEMFNTTTTSVTGCYPDYVFDNSVQIGTAFSCPKVQDDLNKWRLGLGLLDWNGFSLTGIYEHQDLPTTPDYEVWNAPYDIFSYNLPSGADKRDLWQIQAGYAFGNLMLKAMYGESSLDGSYNLGDLQAQGVTLQNSVVYNAVASNAYNNRTSSWAFGVDYNFSKRTKVYALYTATDSDQDGSPVFTNANLSPDVVNSWDGFSLGMMHSF